MSKNINQVFIANPITTNASTDLMYFGQSPYGPGNDAAMTYANFSAQFTLKTLTNTHIFVGNASNVATDVAMSGDATIANTGALTLANTAVTPATYTVNGSNLFTVDSKGRLTSASNVTVTAVPSGSAGGDLGSTYPNPSVVKINGVALGTTTATSGNILIGSGTQWVTNAVGGDATLGSTGTLTLANTTVVAATYTVNGSNLFTVDSKGRLTNASNITITAAPSGSAGGDLSSTYPNPTVAKINGVSLGTTTATSGNLLIGSGTQWVTNAMSGDATISSTGALTLANSGVSAATYTVNGVNFVTFDAKGRATSASNITISASFPYNDVSGTSQAAAVNNGYIISNAAQTTVTLPATAAEGSVIAVQGKGAAGWILAANTGQVIHLGSSASSTAGSLTSTNQWDAVEVVCVTANTTWAVKAVIGNITVA